MTRHTTPLAITEDRRDAGASPLPVFIVDAAAGAIVAANAAARRAWGLDDDDDRAVLAVDRSTPALRSLASLSRTGKSATLTFWAAKGLLQLDCSVECVGSAGDVFLVRGLADQPAGHSRSCAAEPPPRQPAALRPEEADAAQVSALARRLAHEIRTPLSAAIAYAEVLKDEHFGPLPNRRYREYARTIHDSARHALSVVDGMLSGELGGSGLPELAFRDLDPAGVIGNCVAVARPLAERAGLDLVAEPAPGTPRIIADEVSLKQMLLNLITNAIKFARPGDRVTLATRYGADGCLRIEVADTGPGMEALPPHQDATPPDAQGCRPEAGLGIGLPLTRALAEANGATLIVDSTPGRGTRATIAFGKDRVLV
jgi:signal transduction histidine kinase